MAYASSTVRRRLWVFDSTSDHLGQSAGSHALDTVFSVFHPPRLWQIDERSAKFVSHNGMLMRIGLLHSVSLMSVGREQRGHRSYGWYSPPTPSAGRPRANQKHGAPCSNPPSNIHEHQEQLQPTPTRRPPCKYLTHKPTPPSTH
jgi:hypothetical protein